MSHRSTTKPKHTIKRGRYIVLLLIIIIVIVSVSWGVSISMEWQRIITQGDTYAVLLQDMWRRDRTRVKYRMRKHKDQVPVLKPGIVEFSGSYTPVEWFALIDESTGKPQMLRMTLLEWWSSYDVDQKLAWLGISSTWEYHTAITNPAVINEYSQQFKFLWAQRGGSLDSLEWYLYPDTYFIDISKPIIPQLLTLQLQAFQDKVRTPYGSQISSFSSALRTSGYEFDLTAYSLIKLASVIENEEKSDANKPLIAGIFLNRIQQGMRLDADVTLCYGKSVTYDICTPSFIVEHLYDKSNPYNSRQVAWLPPTPISNPSIATIRAVLEYVRSDNLFYLHDAKGTIYPAGTVDQHNANKKQYLK